MNKKVLAVILGGGSGSRLAPLTSTRSKPAVPIAGKYRLVDIPISNCLNSGIERMFVLTQFNSASLNTHIKNSYNFGHFSEAFVDILAAEQTPKSGSWFQGTADAVRKCMHHFLTYDFDYVLILSGDQLYQMDYSEMIKTHTDSNADITIGTYPVGAKDAPGFGILKTDENNDVAEWIEKPTSDLLDQWTSNVSEEMTAQGRNYLASMGIYVFNRDLLIELMADESTTDFGHEIIPTAIVKNKVVSHQFEGYWTDIGTIDSFFEANLELTDDIPQFNLYDSLNTIYTRARLLPPSKITGTTLQNTVVSDGCIILASRLERALIGIRSRIGKGTTIVNSIVMGNDTYQNWEELTSSDKALGIGERCYIENTIIDKNCSIGDDVRIKGGTHLEEMDEERYTIKDGIVIIKKGAIIPNGFTL